MFRFLGFLKGTLLWCNSEQICIYITPPTLAECDTRSIFKQSTVSLNSNFPSNFTPVAAPKQKNSLLYYLLTAGGEEEVDFWHSQGYLSENKMQTTSSKVWTRVTETISSDDNRYAMHLHWSYTIIRSKFFVANLHCTNSFNGYPICDVMVSKLD